MKDVWVSWLESTLTSHLNGKRSIVWPEELVRLAARFAALTGNSSFLEQLMLKVGAETMERYCESVAMRIHAVGQKDLASIVIIVQDLVCLANNKSIELSPDLETSICTLALLVEEVSVDHDGANQLKMFVENFPLSKKYQLHAIKYLIARQELSLQRERTGALVGAAS